MIHLHQRAQGPRRRETLRRSSDQTTLLFDIANQCPIIGGNAVFKARSLYGLIDDTQQYDDSVLCIPYGIDVKRLNAERANSLSVVPNPATDEATLILGQPLEEAGDFMVWNAIGAGVIRVIVPAHTPRFTFNLSGLAPGVYQYKMLSRTGVLGSGKLTIIR